MGLADDRMGFRARLVSMLPLVLGLLNLRLIARRTSPVSEPEWTELARTLSDRLGLRRRVRLVKSSGRRCR